MIVFLINTKIFLHKLFTNLNIKLEYSDFKNIIRGGGCLEWEEVYGMREGDWTAINGVWKIVTMKIINMSGII